MVTRVILGGLQFLTNTCEFVGEKFISIGKLAPSLISPSASNTFLCLVHFHGLRRKCLSSCFSMHYQKNMDTQKLSVSQGDSAFHWLQWSVYIFNTLLTHTAFFSLSVKSGKNIVSVVAVAERTRMIGWNVVFFVEVSNPLDFGPFMNPESE